VHVISFRTLREFAEAHPDAAEPLRAWNKIAASSEWENIAEVRKVYPHADSVGRCTVFNVRGGHYRLVVQIAYEPQVIYVKKVMTHAEYDVNQGKRWKKSCDR
jgi:mRNA interferase HigB